MHFYYTHTSFFFFFFNFYHYSTVPIARVRCFTHQHRWCGAAVAVGGFLHIKNIIVGGGSGAASSNLAATNSELPANISLQLTSVQAAACNWRSPPRPPPPTPTQPPPAKIPPNSKDCLLQYTTPPTTTTTPRHKLLGGVLCVPR